MPINRRKKNVKQRGSKTHGWGSMKKHRGAGNRGGRGNAGTGKRADQKHPTIVNVFGNSYFGKRGFKRQNVKSVKAVNVGSLETSLVNLLSQKIISQEKGAYLIDLKKVGFDKLLGSGKVTQKMVIKATKASQRAVDKIETAGGKVELPSEKQTKKEE